jgi:hypothetical protein
MKEKISAFPIFDNDRVGTDYECHERGMTLRDYFAGQALIGILSSPKRETNEIKPCVRNAYKLADAMLDVRDKE